VWDANTVASAPESFLSAEYKARDFHGSRYTIQVAPDDCTGCRLCAVVCPAKDRANPQHKALDMRPKAERSERERTNWSFFLDLPDVDPEKIGKLDVKGSQLLRPLFEFSGACAGCGETPYIKLLTQLFGDHAVIANATGCTSIYGGNLPTTPYAQRADGRGPAWSNSLFEDAAAFGLGMRLSADKLTEYAYEKLDELATMATQNLDLLQAIRDADQSTQEGIEAQRARVAELKVLLEQETNEVAQQLLTVAEYLVKRSVWVIGGDGWGYDIGYGGLDHVLASGRNVNVLLLDTGVYSNTGGQMSKATPRGAVAKFAAAGKSLPKKDLGMISMTYGNI